MMRCRVILFFFASLSAPFAVAKDTIKVGTISKSAYELRLTSDRELSVDEAQAQLARIASSTCGDRPMTFGRYSFESSAPIDSSKRSESANYVFVQRIDCTAPKPGLLLSPTPALSDADRTSIEAEVR